MVRTNTMVQKNNPCPSRGPALTALPLLPGAQTIKISTQVAGISGKDILNLCYKTFGGICGFPGGAVVENPPANAGDTGSSPDLGRSHMPRSN